MKGWHVAALFAAVFFLKGAVPASGGWFMGLLGLHDFFGWEAPSYFEGAAWMAAFAALLRWARP